MTVNGNSIRISFQWQGRRCRETLPLAPTAPNLKHAGALLRRIKDEIALGTFDYAAHFPQSSRAGRSVTTVADALDAWLDGHRLHITAGTRREYRKSIDRHLVPRIGSVRLVDLRKTDCKRLQAELAEALSAKSVNNTLIPLRRMLADALEDDAIDRDPMANVPSLRVQTEEPDPLTPDEAATVLAALPGGQVRNLYRFALWTGMRPSELIALEWGDVDLRSGVVRVRRARVRGEVKATKTAAGRRDVLLLPEARAAIEAQRAHTQLAGGVVFINPRTGRPWRSDKAMRETHWDQALRRAGIRARTPYQCRHTFASWMLSAGENPVWVARMMGHSSPTMTFRVYGRWIPAADPHAGERAAALLGGGRETDAESLPYR